MRIEDLREASNNHYSTAVSVRPIAMANVLHIESTSEEEVLQMDLREGLLTFTEAAEEDE